MIKRIHSRHVQILSVCLGIVYLWFGFLKFFPHTSPAEHLAKDTIHILTFGLIPEQISYLMLAIWETVLGLLFLLNFRRKWVISLALVHMACTFLPLIFFPDISFQEGSPALTLVGQYIIKNFVIIGALITIYPVTPRLDVRSATERREDLTFR